MIDPGMLDGASVPSRAADVAWVQVDAEAVLYHDGLGTIHVLSPTATLVWRCLDGDSDLESLSQDLADAFEMDIGAVRDDVVASVREFGEQGLLEDVRAQPEAVFDSGPAGSSGGAPLGG